MFGLINLSKPSGMTSRRAIDHVQKLVRPTKVGHAGTLDPLAEGVLVVTIGLATRLTPLIHAWPKSYRATFLLGSSSETEDVTGDVVALCNPPIPGLADLQQAIKAFQGTTSQRPPAYSALKVKGKRAYELARRGESVELAARQITIYQLRIQRYEYPVLELDVVCSGGTYIRSLGRDVARAAGTEAVMSALIRTAVGHLTLESAVPLDDLHGETIPRFLLSPLEAVLDLPQIHVTDSQLRELSHGRQIRLPAETEREIAAVTPDGKLAALLWNQGDHLYRPRRNFVAAQGVTA